MKYASQEIDIRILYRLYLKEIVRHEGYLCRNILMVSLSHFCNDLRKILNDERELWKLPSQLNTNEAIGPTDIDHSCLLKGMPVKKIGNMVCLKAGSHVEKLHCMLEALKAPWILTKCFEERILLIVSNIEPLG